MFNTILFLQETAAEPSGMSAYGNLFFIVAIIFVFYFFMIRPQKKQQEKIAAERNSMKVGDNVVTSGGLYGKIDGVNTTTDAKGNTQVENFIIKLKPEYQVRVQVSKEAVFKDMADVTASK